GKSKGYVPAGMGFGPPGGFLAQPLFAALDANKDGKVSRGEFTAAVRKFFQACDRGEKGFVDERTLAEGIGRLLPGPGGFGPPGGGPGGPGGPGGRGPGGPPGGPFGAGPGGFGPGGMLAGAIVRRADKDKDGKVTLDELLAAAATLFAECDKDKNDTLDQKEV